MLNVETPQDLKQHVGEEMGVSDWVTIDQARIDKFAEATGDHQWIHTDPERAARELPIGSTIAHGYLTLSLVSELSTQNLQIVKKRTGLNYGSNKVRFTGMVPAGSRVRLRSVLKAAEDVKDNGVRVISTVTMEREGAERPVMVAETISIAYA
ncbi:MAG: MaoC family dehydratase [Alphaproteobacteria bacterium]|nr:dehydratase [Rhodospirillaceae bacterium]MDP6019803.1 MaoC family dehydratase [Alphaproteobacteria bacterium]MDP6255387.1 MaoC family dehydratase [Alphaproteobacteria bacterium]MDP7053475.1 MaoC family dehydratase [Alphaproteobacteria bacterium]MDP7229552.1 MaoC family dehydratase [Alphaproteobacteria bacterium]|tara:strand:- start:8276 stop:8734 length:459 start_codon:yes stop_codon:yes gene_type:complete